MTKNATLPYRLGALAFILDEQDSLLLVQPNDYTENAWNVPGGGREANETALENVMREVREELNIDPEELTLLGLAPAPLQHDFPQEMIDAGHHMTKVFRGQSKQPFVFRCTEETKAKIVIDPGELRRSRWCTVEHLSKYLIFPNQHASYLAVIQDHIK